MASPALCRSMSPLPVFPCRHPFAPPALPGFIARMGASDFQLPPIFLAFYTCPMVRPSLDEVAGSPWLPRSLNVRLDTALDPGVELCTRRCAQSPVACWTYDTIGLFPTRCFRGSTPSRSALPVTIAPRLLSCLRIKHDVATIPARLNSRPVASGYLDRLPTCKTTRPCQAATVPQPNYNYHLSSPNTNNNHIRKDVATTREYVQEIVCF